MKRNNVLRRQRARRFRTAALTAALAAAAPGVAFSASFLFDDGARLEGVITEFGSRYMTVQDADGAHHVIERAAVSAVRVEGADGPVQGQLAGWSADGVVIETADGGLEIVDEGAATALLAQHDLGENGAETAAEPALSSPDPRAERPASAIGLIQETAMRRLADGPTDPFVDSIEAAVEQANVDQNTDPEPAALEAPADVAAAPDVAAGSDDDDATEDSTIAEPVEASPQNDEAGADGADEPPAANLAEEPQTANTDEAPPTANTDEEPQTANTDEAPQLASAGDEPQTASADEQPADAAVDGPEAAPAFGVAAAASGEDPELVIPSDSPPADRVPDTFQILTSPPTPTPSADVFTEAPARETASASSPNSPTAPTLSVPSMATPQLTITPEAEEPSTAEDAGDAETETASVESAAIDAPPDAAAPGVAADEEGLIVEAPPSSEAGPMEGVGEDVVEAQLDTEDRPEALAAFDVAAPPEEAADGAIEPPAIPGYDPANLAIDPSQGGLFDEHRMGVFGPPPGQEGLISCSLLGATIVSPRPYADSRPDPGALAVSIGSDAPEAASRALVAAFVGADAEAAPSPDDTALFTLETTASRLGLPDRAIGVRPGPAAEALATSRADVAIVGGAPPPGAYEAGRARLIGFDALIFVAHPDAPQGALSASDFAGLFLGRLSDWSMVDPGLSGPSLLILPPDGAPALNAVLAFADARRASPATSRRIDDAETRIRVAVTTPGAVGLGLLSAADGATPLALGRRSAGVAPSLETIRSGAYPLPWPVYVVLPEEPTHASAAVMFEFLSGPEGQRAVFEAGLTPVAACDPSTCGLTAIGLASARDRIGAPGRLATLQIAEESDVSGQTVVAFTAPADPSAPSDLFVEEIAAFIARIEPGGALSETPLRVVARAGPVDGASDSAQAARLENGLARAQSAALALRCAGLQVEEAVLDPSPRDDDADSAGAIRIELLTRE